jgi:hypothetical protein
MTHGSDRKHNEFLMSQDIRAVGGPEYAENMDKTSVRQEMLLSQPVRTISINASDSSSSDDSDSDSPPPGTTTFGAKPSISELKLCHTRTQPSTETASGDG